MSTAPLERRLLACGLVLVTAHLLDLAFSGPDTTVAGVALIVGLAAVAWWVQAHVGRITRFALFVPVGLLFAAAGVVAHVLDLFTSGPRWTDVTGVGCAIGGVLLVAAGCAALAAPRPDIAPRSRRRRAAHVAGWIVGAFVIAEFVLLPLLTAVLITHAIRRPIDSGALSVPHSTIRIRTAAGDDLAAWYVPPRNGAAVLIVHGSGRDRSSVARQAELVARHGYGVLSIDLPGHGDSDGRTNQLGANAQPAITAALDWLARQPGVRHGRIAGFGMSLGAEVLLEAAARDRRLHAVIADGAERASDDRELHVTTGLARVVGLLSDQAIRAVSGTREAPPLVDLIARIAPRRILLIAAGAHPDEIPVNRTYLRLAGPSAELWAVPDAGHTQAINRHPAEYERRVVAFLDRALPDPTIRVQGPGGLTGRGARS